MQEAFVPREPPPSLLITPCLAFTFETAPFSSSQDEEGKVRTLKWAIILHIVQVSTQGEKSGLVLTTVRLFVLTLLVFGLR